MIGKRGAPPHTRFIASPHAPINLHLIATPLDLEPIPETTMSKINPLSTLSLVLIALGGACLLAFNLIGSTIDAQGVLHEPFGLIPIGWLLIACGVVLGLTSLTRAALRPLKPRSDRQPR